MQLASAVFDRGLGHVAKFDARGQPSGFQWAQYLLIDPVLFGLRTTFLRSMARGWGKVAAPEYSLSKRQAALLGAALDRMEAQ
jgi:hypothetical protein